MKTTAIAVDQPAVRTEVGHRGLAAELADDGRPTGPVPDALTYSDVTSGPTGEAVDPGDRFEEIVDRHGPDSVVAQSRAEARVEMYGMVARTLRRAARPQPQAGALSVTAVQLSCSTLVRFQGVLDGGTAESADRTMRSVLEQRPHAVLIDLALLTAMDGAGALTLTALTPRTDDDIAVALIDPRGRDRALLETLSPAGHRPRIVYGIETALTPHCAT